MKHIAILIVTMFWTVLGALGESPLKIRAWQLHEYDIEYCQKAIDLAPEYDITHIVFSHNLIWYTEEMLYDKRRGGHIDDLAERSHRRGMKTWIWTHEVHGVPDEYLQDGKVTLDNPAFWTLI
ncbi:MAG: hypothetical protein JSW47_05040 [Phycisphaerales bacterium]|nr:MAG: hypothetical protein JSW47_05040 [Phycisphaerales bacterium]